MLLVLRCLQRLHSRQRPVCLACDGRYIGLVFLFWFCNNRFVIGVFRALTTRVDSITHDSENPDLIVAANKNASIFITVAFQGFQCLAQQSSD
jgi:hypothetical protein